MPPADAFTDALKALITLLHSGFLCIDIIIDIIMSSGRRWTNFNSRDVKLVLFECFCVIVLVVACGRLFSFISRKWYGYISTILVYRDRLKGGP